jgi:plasmid replication initiation protein
MKKKVPKEQTLEVFRPRVTSKHSNALINSRHDFTLLERKMLYCVINQLNPTLDNQSDLFGDLYFQIPVSTFGTDYHYRTLTDAMDKLHDRKVRVHDPATKKHYVINPIGFAKLERGIVTLKLQRESIPYFVDIKKFNYTSYELDMILSLTSTYSQTMFEQLSKLKNTNNKTLVLSLEDFKSLFGLDGKRAYDKVNNIILKVLEPAKKELAEKTDIHLHYELDYRNTRKVHGVVIKFEVRKPGHVPSHKELSRQFTEMTPTNQLTFINESLDLYNFTPAQRDRIQQTKKYLDKFIEVHLQLPSNVKNDTSYMAACLRKIGWK